MSMDNRALDKEPLGCTSAFTARLQSIYDIGQWQSMHGLFLSICHRGRALPSTLIAQWAIPSGP